jgi:hypothetical protein
MSRLVCPFSSHWHAAISIGGVKAGKVQAKRIVQELENSDQTPLTTARPTRHGKNEWEGRH